MTNKKMELVFKWTTSRAKLTFGYNVVSLFVDGVKVAACNGGGYDVNYPRLKAGACHDGNIVRID